MASKFLMNLRNKWRKVVETAYNSQEFKEHIKKPSNNYHGPSKWKKSFKREELPVTSRTFVNYEIPEMTKDIAKDIGVYKNPEYFSYHTYSYYDMQRDMVCARAYRPQPSALEMEKNTEELCKCVQDSYEKKENPKIIKKIS